MFTTFIHNPRRLWPRKALFQIHLWMGVLLSLYIVVIGLSGSILVFQDEIRRASFPHAPLDRTHLALVSTVLARAHQRFPAHSVTFVAFPHQPNPWWTLYLADAHGKPTLAYADAATAMPLAPQGRLFIDWVLDLHVYLLAGHTGFVVNCLMGIGLLLLAISGAILWWPGIKLWRRAFLVSLRHGPKRVNYDLHSAIGIWTLLIVTWWGLTAVYFLYPAQFSAAVNAVSPLAGMREPASPSPAPNPALAPPPSPAQASLDSIVAAQPLLAPGLLSGLALPSKPGGNVTLYIDRRTPGDFSHRDIVTLDGHTGKPLTIWHYGENHSLGDWFLWLMYPLHFGTLWGFAVKILWSILGLALSALSLTGLLMYWNRKLSKVCLRKPSAQRAF